MSGTLLGREGGAFAKFPLAYSGDEQDVIIELTLSPEDPTWGERLGVEIYNPNGKLIGTGTATDTLGIRKVTFASDLAGEYTIVVFNYAEGLPLLYSVKVTR